MKLWMPGQLALLERLREEGQEWDAIALRCEHSAGSCKTTLGDLLRKRQRAEQGRPPKRPWTEADVQAMVRMREIDRMIWSDIDHALQRASGAAWGKYDSLRRHIQREKLQPGPGRGGRINSIAAEADRDARKALQHGSLTAQLFGDPLPGRSALDQLRSRVHPANVEISLLERAR